MKPFRFKLAQVLKVRSLEVKQAQQALAAAQAAAQTAQDAVDRAISARRSFEERLAEQRTRRMTMRDWVMWDVRLQAMRQVESEASAALKEAVSVVALRLTALEAAKSRERVLEKMRERRQVAYRHEAQLEEQAIVDEIAQNMRRAQKGVGSA